MKLDANTNLTRRTFVSGGAAAALLAGCMLAGCAQSGGSSSSSAASSASGSSSSSSGTSSFRELTAACSAVSVDVNPVGNTSALMLSANWHVLEGLYDLDFHTYKTYNALAAAEPEKISDTEYRISLREGAKFSNGTEVKASDVVNAFNQNMADATYGAFLSFIDTVEAQDDITVVLRLKHPFANLLKNRLSLVRVFPSKLSDDELETKPIGTGPWMYDSIATENGGQISFRPNPNYTGSLPAGADAMRWQIVLDGAERATALREKKVQAIDNVPPANASQLKDEDATVEYIQGFSQAFLMFNCQKKPFNDLRVRQAFFYAIDVEKLIANTMAGHATAVTGFLPKTFPHYHEASTVYTHNPDKAKQLLAAAGVQNLEFEMMTNSNWVKDLAGQIQDDLAAVGITMKNKETQIDWASLAPSSTGALLPFDVLLSPGDPSCFGNDPDLLMTWWYGDNVWTQGRSCWAKSGDGKFEELQILLQKAREAEGAAQQDIWNKCFDLIAEQVPLYALFHREVATGYWDSMITGFEPIGTSGLSFLGASVKDTETR